MLRALLSPAEHLGAVISTGAALLLVWAGLPSALSTEAPWGRRARAGVELLLALAILVIPGRPAGLLGAALFGGFCAVHLRDRLTGGRCDCFGVDEAVPAGRAAGLTAGLALLCLGAGLIDAPSLRELAGRDPAALAWTPTAALALAVAWRLAFSGPAAITGLARAGADLVAGVPGMRRPSSGGPMAADLTHAVSGSPDLAPLAGAVAGTERRSFLLSVAVVGSALAVAPLRYLLYPGTALAAVVRPWECGSGICTDGYTGFCCEITPGGGNVCPTGTFPGGWWMCTDYSGRQLCSEEGVRYYVDCNALPGHPFPGGCRCANGNCNERKIACNIFRYGQCNTQIEGVTAVVCRMITCENPATIDALHCSAALATDDSTCGHEAPCLEPRALEFAGAGGA